MAPSEIALCFDLIKPKLTWEEKAEQLLDVMKNYYCMRVFFKDITEISGEVCEFIYKKKLLPKDDTFWTEPKVHSL